MTHSVLSRMPSRAGLAAALIAFACASGFAADKAYQRGELDEAAIRLEAQIKSAVENAP